PVPVIEDRGAEREPREPTRRHHGPPRPAPERWLPSASTSSESSRTSRISSSPSLAVNWTGVPARLNRLYLKVSDEITQFRLTIVGHTNNARGGPPPATSAAPRRG